MNKNKLMNPDINLTFKPIIRGMVLHFFDGRQVLSFRLERIFENKPGFIETPANSFVYFCISLKPRIRWGNQSVACGSTFPPQSRLGPLD
jgi:hypothetical protein